MPMNYQQFASDILPYHAYSFDSPEENEETLMRLGVHQEVRQIGSGEFHSCLAARVTDQAELFSDRYSTALSLFLEPPEGQAGLLFPRTASGQFWSSGENTSNDKLVFLPAGSATDIIGPALVGSEDIGIPQRRFIEMTE